MIKKYLIPSSLVLMMCGCAGSAVTSSGDPTAKKPSSAVGSELCLVSQPEDVNMWINAMPGPGTSKKSPLRVSFRVTAPTPGYIFTLKVNRVMESSPEQVVLDLIVKRPMGIVAQVITESDVNIKLDEFPGSQGSSVQVNCAGKPFFKVGKIMAVY